MSTVLKTNDLSKFYGSLGAVQSLDLSVEEGQVFGLLGPNGSGKTTTLGMILGVIRPSSGSFEWYGATPGSNSRKKIGAILEKPSFYPYMSAKSNLKIVAKIKEVDEQRIEQVLREVGLGDRMGDRFETYSLGMKQRLAIASALLADPPVLILDEPTNGLDPQGIVEIREIIQKIAQSGKTIILASHLLDEVQKVCTHFAVLNKGKKLFQGSVEEAVSGQTVVEVGASNLESLKTVLEGMAGVRNFTLNGSHYRLDVEPEVTVEYISKTLLDNGITPTHLNKSEGSLEQEFMKILDQNA
ncbi:MAG: ATP-binding cassette domain-containing protein [Cyclobacteriaceae bacterium]